jgi:hypothetical protein
MQHSQPGKNDYLVEVVESMTTNYYMGDNFLLKTENRKP